MVYAIELQSNIIVAIHSFDNVESVRSDLIVVADISGIELGQVFEGE